MGTFFLWYLVIFLLGLIGFPISFRLLTKLKDRGYTLVKSLSLLVWGYLFWLLCVLGLVQNNIGGVVFALVVYLGISIACLNGKLQEIRIWIRDNYRILLLSEAVFFIAFALWTVVRAANPALIGTEKPMELAFINAILKSPTFPPIDPWLSGYSISYYYFGYVIVSMLIRITGTLPTIAFNLMLSLLFGLVAVSSFGILNNLLQTRNKEKDGAHFSISQWLAGLLGPVFILIIGNLEGFLEMLHAKGLFWTRSADGSFTSKFWNWLRIPEIELPPTEPFSWIPNRQNGYWWWRASRVLQDYKISGERIEIIDEFPQFSYILADMHPHVLSMPFVLLAVGVIFNIFLAGSKSAEGKVGILSWMRSKLFKREGIDFQETYVYSWVKDPIFWLIALIAGGIAFFNIWDFPIYVGLLCLSTVLYQYWQTGWGKARWIEFFETGILTGLAGILLYLPYYLGFGSQAGGVLPSLNFYTRGVYFWIMFGGLLIPICGWMIWRRIKTKNEFNAKFGGIVSGGLVFGLWVVSYLFTALLLVIGGMGDGSEKVQDLLGQFYWLQGGVDGRTMLVQSFANRLVEPGTWITLLIMLALVWGLLAGIKRKKYNQVDRNGENKSMIAGFVLLLILLGLGLALVPEFFYLRDQFGTRMNTIFKFYFQTWILWGLAASFALIVLWRETKGFARLVIRIASIFLIGLGLAYPVFAILRTTNNLNPQTYQDGELVSDWSLDGALYRTRNNPDEMAAIKWLRDKAPLGVVAEAVGGSYTDYARVATYSGMPNVLGWPGHESQWRGGGEEMGSRESDIELVYRSGNWDQVQMILDQYNIRYVFLGNLEQIKYGASDKVFSIYLAPVFQAGDTKIFEYNPLE